MDDLILTWHIDFSCTKKKHFELLSRAKSKFYRDNWPSYRQSILVGSESRPRNIGVSGKNIKFLNGGQFLEFQNTEESTYLWGDYHDLVVLSEMTGVGVDCLIVENGVVNPAKTIHADPKLVQVGFRPKQDFSLKRITLANLENSHFVAIVDTSYSEKRDIIEKGMRDFRNYVNGPVRSDKKAESNDVSNDEKNVNRENNTSLLGKSLELEKMFETLSKRFDQNENEIKELKVGFKSVNEQNEVLKQNQSSVQELNEIGHEN